MKVVSVVGTRPEIVKMAPVVRELDAGPWDHILIDSGQHYDANMSRVFYEDMSLRDPDLRFDLRGSSPVEHFTETMAHVADAMAGAGLVVVEGDTNTALAAALAANKLGVPVAHVEAGLRSYDRRMPEENNRVLIDHLADLLFAPSEGAKCNLAAEGIRTGVEVVGNTVTDSLLASLPKVDYSCAEEKPYAVATMHRIENLNPETLSPAFKALRTLSKSMTVLFFAHPRTLRQIEGIPTEGIRVEPPARYLRMLAWIRDASLVLTDSGGLQEEACFLHVPCVTLRSTTERPETVEVGANRLALTEPEIESATHRALRESRTWAYPYGDGHSALRIAKRITEFLEP